jgi:hypothetical protein
MSFPLLINLVAIQYLIFFPTILFSLLNLLFEEDYEVIPTNEAINDVPKLINSIKDSIS